MHKFDDIHSGKDDVVGVVNVEVVAKLIVA
jgi:hypothetical protein